MLSAGCAADKGRREVGGGVGGGDQSRSSVSVSYGLEEKVDPTDGRTDGRGGRGFGFRRLICGEKTQTQGKGKSRQARNHGGVHVRQTLVNGLGAVSPDTEQRTATVSCFYQTS